MSEKTAVIVYKESLAQSIISDATTFGFLLLCIWASQGSTWWTFFTGAAFIFLAGVKVSDILNSDRCHRFYSLDEMQNWIDAQKQESA